jgi:error-prone DNA polymerase
MKRGYGNERTGMDSRLWQETKFFITHRPLQDALTAIRHGISVTSCGHRLKPNAMHSLHTPFTFSRLFADDPAAIVRIQEIADRCSFSLA